MIGNYHLIACYTNRRRKHNVTYSLIVHSTREFGWDFKRRLVIHYKSTEHNPTTVGEIAVKIESIANNTPFVTTHVVFNSSDCMVKKETHDGMMGMTKQPYKW